MTRNLTVVTVFTVLLTSIVLLPMATSLILSFTLQIAGLLLTVVAWILAIFVWLIIAFFLAYFVLAPRNIFSTFIYEGTAKLFVRGKEFSFGLMRWKGYDFKYNVDPNGCTSEEAKWEVVSSSGPEKKPFLGGFMVYTLFWPVVDALVHKFRWTTVKEDGKKDPKEEWQDFFLLPAAVYHDTQEKCEDSLGVPLQIVSNLTARIVNPYKANYRVQDWLEYLKNQVWSPFLRAYITTQEYQYWHTHKDGLNKELQTNFLKSDEINELKEKYGILVEKIAVTDINPPEETRKKTLQTYEAEMDKRKKIIDAEAEAARIKTVFKQIEDFGQLGQLIRTLEAIEQSEVATSISVQAIPGLSEMLRGVFGKTPPENVTKDDIRELRELIEKFIQSQKGRNV